MQHTDRKREVKPDLFERIYDRAVTNHFQARSLPRWWSVHPRRNRRRVLSPEIRRERRLLPRTICICHDIERGLGHRDTDPDFALQAERDSPGALTAMLAIERSARLSTTYCVVGSFMSEVRGAVEADGHCLAFHSFDHDLGREQLGRCREVDYRVKGYRAPRSQFTEELTDERLCWHNFEWFASSQSALGFNRPRLHHRLVKIPIYLDDSELHRGKFSFDQWAARVLDLASRHDFLAIGLHDCYAAHWLPGYPHLLEELGRRAEFRTMDEVAADLYLAGGI